ncbi:MAG: Hsp70 family protein [Lachnospiraceae bacterium]|nr:Hsp70 family protein [Lachnospiraceae bacterium]
MAQLYVGIDLGTTNSTVSVIQTEDRRLRNPIDHLRSIPILQYDKDFNLTRDKYTLPSYFYCKNDGETKRVYTGEWAKNIYATGNQPMNTFTGIKTRMGGESMITIPGKSEDDELQLDMTQCSALLLKTMKQSIEEQFDQEIDHLVVTVPAAFNTDERQATRDAIEMAGFTNFHILDEPAATLLYFINNGDGCLMQNSVDLNNKYIMIYDIGGGTLDICIAKLEEDDTSYEYESMKVSIASRSKRENLGGNDFDQYLGAYFLSEFENRTAKISTRPVDDQNKIIARVVSQAEKYKIDLNNKLKEHIDNPRRLSRIVMTPEFEVIDGQFVQGINLDKETLEEVYAGIITDSDRQNILRPVKESIKSAENLSKEDISLIILTGGMSNFYAVESTLKEYFGDDVPMITVDTTTSVSKGAAIDAYNYSPDNIHLKKMSLEDRLAEDIFLRTNTGFEKLISKSEISTKKKGQFTYTIQQENMTNLPIFLFYGQDTNFTEDFTQIAGKMVPLPRRFEVGEQVTLEWSIDQNGVITIALNELGEEIKLNQGANQELLAKKKIIDEIQIN